MTGTGGVENASCVLHTWTSPLRTTLSPTPGTASRVPSSSHQWLAGVKAMSGDRGALPPCVIELVPLPVSSLHSLLTGEKRFFSAFSFSTARAAEGLAAGDGVSPAAPLCRGAEGPILLFSCQACTLWECLSGTALVPVPPRSHPPPPWSTWSCCVHGAAAFRSASAQCSAHGDARAEGLWPELLWLCCRTPLCCWTLPGVAAAQQPRSCSRKAEQAPGSPKGAVVAASQSSSQHPSAADNCTCIASRARVLSCPAAASCLLLLTLPGLSPPLSSLP